MGELVQAAPLSWGERGLGRSPQRFVAEHGHRGQVVCQIGRQVTITREAWPWLAIVLLGLLGFEWYAFHRRVYVS